MTKVRVVSKKKVRRFFISCFFGFVLLILLGSYLFYQNSLKGVNDKSLISFEVLENDTYSTLASRLKQKKLIKNELTYKVYLKLHTPKKGLKVGFYPLNKAMGVVEILNVLEKGPDSKLNNFNITFPEGIHMRKVAALISSKTGYTKESVLEAAADKTFLNKMISKYWFLENSILDKNIYYPLEGYLYPDTYTFSKDDTVQDILNKMLSNTEKKLKPIKQDIEKNKYSTHEILTLASVVELEASTKQDREGVAAVFFNRLNKGMGLESDVTTYYGLKKELTESINGQVYEYTPYNTRNTSLNGKLPIGPICSPSIDSIEAVIHPKTSKYYYFVADTSKKVYFATTYQEHLGIIKKLKGQGKWNA